MKIIGVIPARYKSSRFPGKPLMDICGKPMVWWTYQQAIKYVYSPQYTPPPAATPLTGEILKVTK